MYIEKLKFVDSHTMTENADNVRYPTSEGRVMIPLLSILLYLNKIERRYSFDIEGKDFIVNVAASEGIKAGAAVRVLLFFLRCLHMVFNFMISQKALTMSGGLSYYFEKTNKWYRR
jgi:hypothetical protein